MWVIHFSLSNTIALYLFPLDFIIYALLHRYIYLVKPVNFLFHHIFLVTLQLFILFSFLFVGPTHEQIHSAILSCKLLLQKVDPNQTFYSSIKDTNNKKPGGTHCYNIYILFLKIRLWRLKNDNPSFMYDKNRREFLKTV